MKTNDIPTPGETGERGQTMKYQIESRWPSWAKWRKVTARPHDERMPFNEHREIEFLTETEAVHAIASMSKANAGEYRIVEKMSAV